MTSPIASRAGRFAALANTRFDVLVIGGGITGCGIARDAALRGLFVALVEKDDFASGTSSRSSRLIHGGVRYLEHGHLHLVFESSAERRRLLRLAPHLVRPLAFTWPVYAGARVPRWKLSAGLTIYDALALFRNVGRHRRLSREGVLESEPSLRADQLVGGARYFDAATNDARLTLANALGAAAENAVVVNHAQAVELRAENGRVVGAVVRDMLGGERVNVTADVVVNAVGPWTSGVRGSKGAHVAVPRERVGNRSALTLLSPTDGRVLFALPAGPHTIVGTTDSYDTSSPDDVRASNEDVQYLLGSANTFFPRAALTPNDVVSAWAGIRPLLPATGATPGAATREHAIIEDERGVVTITGGKLTTYRIMARDAVDAVVARLRRSVAPSRTGDTTLPGGDFRSLDVLTDDIARATNDMSLATHLAATYGTRWSAVWKEILQDDGRSAVQDGLPYTLGELRYAIRHEMACTLGDLLIRRTHVAFETRDHGLAAAERVSLAVASLFDWDNDSRRKALADYEAEVERMFVILRHAAP